MYVEAWIAQLVEQWTEDPRVTSSNLVPGMIKKLKYSFRRFQNNEHHFHMKVVLVDIISSFILSKGLVFRDICFTV